MTHRLLSKVEALLDEERMALLDGDMQVIGALSERKSQLVAELDRANLPPNMLKRLRKRGDQNARLFVSALKGLKAAQSRLKDISDVKDGLSLYTDEGSRIRIPTQNKALEKKA